MSDHTTTEPFTNRVPWEMDGVAGYLEVTGEIETIRGPLGRIIDVCDQIRAEGLEVPPLIAQAIEQESLPKE